MKHMTCEICGGDILAKSGGVYVCTGCGMQYDRERILEMAEQYRREPAEAAAAMPEAADPVPEELPQIVPAVRPEHKKIPNKKLLGIGIAAVCAAALLMVLLPFGKKAQSTPVAPGNSTAAPEAVRNPVEEDIQGLWYYEDPEIGWHEEHYFCGGLVASINWLDSAPEKANNSVGEYQVLDGQVRRRSLQTDYVLYYDYYYEGDELVLSWYIDSGRDAGSSRVYRKVSDSSSPKNYIPEKFGAGTTAQKDTGNVSNGMKNALQKAQTYLQIMDFSRQGLIDQLEYDGFTYSEAAYAADECGADWYQQAVKRAESYLEIMSFSRQGLIDQLEYDGFLYDQAVYGVDQAY